MSDDQIANTRHHAEQLVDYLVDYGPVSKVKACADLGWTPGRFGSALRYAREQLLPGLDLTIPAPTPEDGWLYQVTDEWGPIALGASFTLGLVESRLIAVLRDVRTVLPTLDPRSLDGRAANLLDKRLTPLVKSLEEIYGPWQVRKSRRPTPRRKRGGAA
jgi:hypothetical protein